MAIIANVKCKWPHGECYSTFSVKTLSLATSLNLIFVILKFFCSRTFESFRLDVSKSSFSEKLGISRRWTQIENFRANFFEYCISQHIKKSPIFLPVYCAVIGQIKGSSCDSSLPMSHQFLNFFIFSFIFNQITP